MLDIEGHKTVLCYQKLHSLRHIREKRCGRFNHTGRLAPPYPIFHAIQIRWSGVIVTIFYMTQQLCCCSIYKMLQWCDSSEIYCNIIDFPSNFNYDGKVVGKMGLFWLSIVSSPQLISEVTRTWGTSIVTSCSSIVLARASWRKGDLH